MTAKLALALADAETPAAGWNLLRRGLLLGAVAALAGCAQAGGDAGQVPPLASAPARRVPLDVGAMAPMTASALPSHVGEWIYDPDGEVVGSLERLRGDSEALVHVSVYLMPGNKFVVVPVRDLGLVGGRVVLHGVAFNDLETINASAGR
jgi:hypothetical protein